MYRTQPWSLSRKNQEKELKTKKDSSRISNHEKRKVYSTQTPQKVKEFLKKYPNKEFTTRELAKQLGMTHTSAYNAIRDLSLLNEVKIIAVKETQGGYCPIYQSINGKGVPLKNLISSFSEDCKKFNLVSITSFIYTHLKDDYNLARVLKVLIVRYNIKYYFVHGNGFCKKYKESDLLKLVKEGRKIIETKEEDVIKRKNLKTTGKTRALSKSKMVKAFKKSFNLFGLKISINVTLK